jgi:hypothetical protein
MSVNNVENNFNPTDKIFDGYKPDVSFFEEKTRNDLIIDHYQNSVPTNLDYSLAPDFSVNLSFLKNQSFQVYDYIEQTIKSIEELLIKVVYINEEITPDMEECHTKLWEELCKYNDIEMSEPEFVCFEEYKYAERSTSTVARRFISEFNQICSQNAFSFLLNYRSLLKAMLNEAYYIKNFILINFEEQYTDDSQKEIAVQFDAWAKVATQCTKRIVESISSPASEIAASELGQVTEKQAVEFQAFFSIRLEALNEEIANLLNSLKRDYVDSCNIFYDRYLAQSLKFKTNIVLPMEINFYTTTFANKFPMLTEELVIATNIINANFGMILSDLIQRNQIVKIKLEKCLDLIKDKRKYSNYIYQLSFKGQNKKIIIKKVTEDNYSVIFKNSHTTYKDQSDLLSDHASLHNLTENHHPQYLLRDGGEIIGDISVAKNIKIDGVSLSGHAHTGNDGSKKIRSTDIDYDTPRSDSTVVVPKVNTVQIDDIVQEIIDGGVPVVDVIVKIEVDDNNVSPNHEYEIFVYEV